HNLFWVKDSPTISSLLFQRASALFASSAYARTPSLMALMVALSGTMLLTWQFSQYLPPISPASATIAAHTEVAAPWGTVFHLMGGLPSAASCAFVCSTSFSICFGSAYRPNSV